MGAGQSYKNKDGISEWSKWITGISLFSASGCVSVLVAKGVGEKNIINIKLAIVFFLITILVAWLIQLAIAMEAAGEVDDGADDHLATPGRADQQGATVSLDAPVEQFISRTPMGVSSILKSLIVLEILVFACSCFYLARWVWKFPSAAPPQASAITATKPT
jgi:hypothetical protein